MEIYQQYTKGAWRTQLSCHSAPTESYVIIDGKVNEQL